MMNEIMIRVAEIKDAKFFPIDDLPDNISSACMPALRKYLESRG